MHENETVISKNACRVDIENRTMDFEVTFPNALLAGSYKLSGNLLFVPVAGDGHFWLNLGKNISNIYYNEE
jgi:hypothetical protein